MLSQQAREARRIFESWEHQVDFAPVLLCRGALSCPIGRVIQLIGHLRRPEASGMAVEQIAFHRMAQSRRAAVMIGFPTRRKDKSAAEWDVRARGLLWRSLQRHDIVFDAFGLSIN